MESIICYPGKDFEDFDGEGRMYNNGVVSESWELLDNDLTTRLSGSVKDITLHFEMMMATCDRILKDTHMEKLLDSLITVILVSCGCLSSFSIHLSNSWYFTEKGSDNDMEEHTMEEQWKGDWTDPCFGDQSCGRLGGLEGDLPINQDE